MPSTLRTRHNAGFWFVDELARRHGGAFRHEAKHQGELARVRIGGAEIWLLKPMTYMNRSGGPTRAWRRSTRCRSRRSWWRYDELDFPPGVVRLKQGGGAAGNNGVKDLIAQLGDEFWRLRIGVGKPPRDGHRARAVAAFRRRMSKLIRECDRRGGDAVPVMLEQGGAEGDEPAAYAQPRRTAADEAE